MKVKYVRHVIECGPMPLNLTEDEIKETIKNCTAKLNELKLEDMRENRQEMKGAA